MKKRLAALVLIVSVLMALAIPAYADAVGYRLGSTSLSVQVGQTATIPAYNGSVEASGVIWHSNNETVATVDGYGKVTGIKMGQTTVTAMFPDGSTAACAVSVGNGIAPLNGIDVSEHQGPIDWAAVKNSGVDFAMIRTGYGGDLNAWDEQTDSYFEANYSGAVQNGIKVGAYHYSYATNVTMASQEADFALHILNGRHLDYPVAYDVENAAQNSLSTDTLGAIVQTFASKLQQAGYKVAVYSFVNFYNAHLTSPLVSQYDTWIANTGVSVPNFGHPYTMWQYGTRTVAGVSGVCDVDYSYYDYAGNGGSGGSGGGQPTLPTDPLKFQSDTNGTYTFGSNQDYTYKITTADTIAPSVSSSNPSAVTAALVQKVSDGFVFKITRVGPGQATITTTAADGRSTSFVAVVPSSTSTITPPAQSGGASLKSDTTMPYTFSTNSVYTYKITTNDSVAPKAVSSNPSAVTVNLYQKTSGGYLFQIHNVGKGQATIATTSTAGPSTSFIANGTASDAFISDTPANFSMQLGKTYQYKFTPPAGVTGASFSTGNGSIIQTVSVTKSGGSWYYKIKAVGKGSAGVYATAQGKSPVRECVVTVS